MRDQVAMTKGGDLCVAIPLYRYHHEQMLGKIDGYSIALTNDKPLAYAIDIGDACQVINAEIAEKYLEMLGDLEETDALSGAKDE